MVRHLKKRMLIFFFFSPFSPVQSTFWIITDKMTVEEFEKYPYVVGVRK